MNLPRAEHAIVELQKLRHYCLNREHPRGRHKARVFESALGFTVLHAEELREILLAAAQTNEALPVTMDAYGQRYIVDVIIRGPRGIATVRSAWIVRAGEGVARLTGCYVL